MGKSKMKPRAKNAAHHWTKSLLAPSKRQSARPARRATCKSPQAGNASSAQSSCSAARASLEEHQQRDNACTSVDQMKPKLAERKIRSMGVKFQELWEGAMGVPRKSEKL